MNHLQSIVISLLLALSPSIIKNDYEWAINQLSQQTAMNLNSYISTLSFEAPEASEERLETLQELASYIIEQKSENKPIALTFICTHNSRRSHLSQIWAAIAAHHFQIADQMSFYSGGTEVTAFNHRAVAALERAGVQITSGEGANPKYQVQVGAHREEHLVCFSKKFADPANPTANFIAVMTCTDADQGCPIVPGADFRIAIPYEDPKNADGTNNEMAIYDERCKQIATEMFHVMYLVNHELNRK